LAIPTGHTIQQRFSLPEAQIAGRGAQHTLVGCVDHFDHSRFGPRRTKQRESHSQCIDLSID
jgi:hypothetical protein